MLAAYLQAEDPEREVRVASLSFRENASLHACTLDGLTVEEAWNKGLTGSQLPLTVVHVEDIAASARQAAGSGHAEWLGCLEERYGI